MTEQSTENTPWYCLRLFTMKPYDVSQWLESQGLTTFIPEHYVDVIDTAGQRSRELRPVVRNFVFVQQPKQEDILKEILTQSLFKLSLVRSSPSVSTPALIPAVQMREFMLLCNPELTMKEFISEEEARIKPGDSVTVLHGPLTGLTGRLVRKAKKYYLLKEVPGMGVMIKVSKWCCQKL